MPPGMHKVYRVYRYALFLLDRFKWLVLLALFTFVVSTWILYRLHPDQADPATRKDVGEVSFGVFELMFASQPALPYPKGNVPSELVFFILPILNILGLAAAIAQMTRILFDRSLYNQAQADSARRHVILCGVGRLGREVLKQLDLRHDMKKRRDIVIVEGGHGVDSLDSEYIRREPIVPVLHGNMIDPQTLRDAGIKRALAVCMLTGDDTTNLEAGLLARELNPNVRVILRMSNKRVTQRLDAMLRRSPIQNFQLIDSVEGSAPKCLEMCQIAGVACVEPAASNGHIDPADPSGHVVVCGLGRLGFGVVRLLKGRVPILVVDNGERLDYADEPAITDEPQVPILRADMTVKRVLQQAGVERAVAVLILTPHDTQNLEAAMLVHELNPKARTVMRISNSRISRRLDRVLHEAFRENLRVIDPSEHAAPRFVDAVTAAYAPRAAPSLARKDAEENELVGL
jgi:Trk K+ transport system NAD-binding subunit